MSFVESQLDLGIDYGAVGGPVWSTAVSRRRSGHETRNQEFSQPLGRWELGQRMITREELDTLLDWHYSRRGAFEGFRYKDWQDWTTAAGNATPTDTDQTLGTGDDTETEFQLIKLRGSFSRTITKPVAGSTVVSLDDVSQPSGWSVDTTTGVITFSTPPATDVVVKAGCEFDVPVRFEADSFVAEFRAYEESTGRALYFLRALGIVMVRP